MLRILQIIYLLIIPALVAAHGYVQQVTIDGTVYMGNSLNVETPAPSIIRQVSTNSPVKGATNPDIFCGQQAQLASLVGNANPGSQVEVLWVGGTDGSSNVCRFTPVLEMDVDLAAASAVAAQYRTADALHDHVRGFLHHVQLNECRVVQDC